ncbi:hypothetical protein [Dietzia sp. ANT_WB102]|uniref:hypothetical protein n=1 Tax=Dietzia sp. ANT_WB102 TaxID=2597345 RepID=UPI0011F0519F|nr:hypothetical protein [Dietzia sp. ANT_WB102]KAA0918760.1 hypothetical protein FQ137_05405 [Dietzia sp. ANT_WB102]
MDGRGEHARTRVAVLPAAHPAVRRITGLDVSSRVELVPVRPGVVNSQTPTEASSAVEFDPAAVASGEIDREGDSLSSVDLAHVHFGYDYLEPDSVDMVVRHLAGADVPMVLTVHDIVYPTDEDELPHRDHTGTLVEAAAAVITLTEVAAHELWVRWGVEPLVIPHPRLLSEEEISAAVRGSKHLRSTDSAVVGVLLERMGENIEGPELLDQLASVASGRPGAELRILVEAQAWRDACGDDGVSGSNHLVAEFAAEGDWTSVRLVRYESLDLGSLLAEVAALDVCVLPYRFATHSTWLELCRDLGVAPVFPAVGCLWDQWFDRCDPAEHSGEVYDPRDPAAVATAVRASLDTPLAVPPRVEGADPSAVVAEYSKVYSQVAGFRP